MTKVLVLLLILGATVGVSPALAQSKKPSTPHTAQLTHDGRAIAIIAGH